MFVQGPLRKQCWPQGSRRALPWIGIHLLIFVAFAAFAASASAQTQDAIDDFVRTEMERQKTPGVSIAVIRRGEVVKVKGYGFANVEHQAPVKPETIFESGSMGKQFTSTAVMLLVEDGKIALTDSIAKYFPEAPERFRPITVRHLLTHTSGIPDYTAGTMDYRRDYTED